MKLQKRLKLDLPIIQAPMAGVQGSALAIAVSEAGGLGSLPCAMLSPETLYTELRAIKTQTSKPFNVNFFCHTQPVADPEREAQWRQQLAGYYAELNVDPKQSSAGPSRLPFSQQSAEILAEFKPPVVSFHFGLPSADLLEYVHSWGAFVLSSATTLAEALWLEAHGADAVIAQGLEAGGHRGHFLSDDLSLQLGTLALIPQLVDELKIPVIAAGGIADARGVKAALALGAQAVQIGSAYLLCPEATTSQVHRQMLTSPQAQHTAITNLFSGRPARGIVNRLMQELGPSSEAVPAFPLATAALAPLRAQAESQNSADFSPLWAGQNVSGCQDISAAELTRQLAHGIE